MRSSTWRLEDLRNVILNLGFVGENLHTHQIFDCKKMFDQYPNASVSMTVTPPEGEPYPGTIERDGDMVIWNVRDSDLVAEGDGEIQLVFTQEPHIARSYNARTHICRSQVPTGSIPSGLDDYITRADQLLDEVKDTFPAGGTTGQVLAKKSDEDYDTEWVPQGTAEDLIDDTAGDGDTDKTWSADKLHDEFNGKANKYNTVLTSTLSRGRREGSTVGKWSYAFGDSVVASGKTSHAEGFMSEASGENSHAEGHGTLASNARAHAEGYTTQANGANAHAEGYNTKANGPHSHAEGNNTIASHKSQHVFGEFNIADDSSASATNRGNYVEIVGNGTGPNTKSNARTLDWDGNEELAGDLTIKKGTANEVKVSELYKKPATGIPASDLEDGVITDPEDLIDDNAGEGDTDKVWSADKSHELLTEINSRYTKPNTGIPATDMASSVQTSLNNADSAYQKPQTGIPASDMAEGVIPDISGKADKTVTDALQKNKAPVIIDSAEGNPIVLTDGADGLPIEVMKIHFLPKQDTSGGDPSPSNVCPISGWSGVTAWRTGANLIDDTKKYMTGSTTCFVGKETAGYLFFLKAGKYTFSADLGEELYGLYYQDKKTATQKTVWGVSDTIHEKTITIDEDGLYRIFFYKGAAYGGVDASKIKSVTLNYGESASTYSQYTGDSYPVTFPALGKNLFNGVWTQGNIQEGRKVDSTTAMCSGFINVLPSTSYYVYTERSSNVFIFEYDGEGNYLNRVKNIATGNVLATGDGTGKIRIVDRNSGTEAVDTGINYPSTETAYEPYTNTIYGGTVYPLDGRMLVEWEYAVLNDPDKWSEVSDNNYKFIYDTGFPQRKKYQDSYTDLLCSAFVADSTKRLYCRWNGASGGKFEIQDKDSTLTLADVKQMATSGDIAIAFPIATSYEIPLDPITVQTLIGDNTIWSDANGTIELDYRADTKLFIAKQKTDIRATIAPIEDGTTASQAYSAGKFFYHDGQFCKAKTSIASGATFTLNTNYEITTVADELFALN